MALVYNQNQGEALRNGHPNESLRNSHQSDPLHDGPPSPSLTNPDMILPYDPRLRDSNSTRTSGGPDISSLNDQMAISLSTTRAINGGEWEPQSGKKRRSMPGEWNNEDVASPANPTSPTLQAAVTSQSPKSHPLPEQQRAQAGGNAFHPGTSFLNLSRFSTISALSGGKSEGSNGVPPIEEDEEEAAARNDFARAEEILANAKKRLTTMEGNLTRARSLSVSRSPSAASNLPEDTSFSARLHNGQPQHRQNGWAISAAKLRQANWTPIGGSTNHTRVFSENAIPNPSLSLVEKVNGGEQRPIRSSSAMGSIHGEDQDPAADSYRNYHRGGFGNLEPLREDELLSPSSESPRSHSRGGLDRFHDLSAKARSNVQLRDLREQMTDLKGKLDVLKRRTREDSLHRRSMQYLKSPSPFTDAEAWRESPSRGSGSRQSTRPSEATPRPGDTPRVRKGSDAATPTPAAPAHPGSPRSGTGSVATAYHDNKIKSQMVALPSSNNDTEPLNSPGSMAGGPRGVIDGALSNLDDKIHHTSAPGSPRKQGIAHRPNLSGTLPIPLTLVEKSAFDPWSPQSEKAEILNWTDEDAKATTLSDKAAASEADDEGTQKADSEGPTTGSPATELAGEAAAAPTAAEVSHEDRPDAFDYENFIISSTMGTYSRRHAERSRSSSASASTIGPDAYLDSNEGLGHYPDERPTYQHARHPSAGSTSSLDTFATANSRSGSRMQAGSQQAMLREAASREALGRMPGAFIGSAAPTPTPGDIGLGLGMVAEEHAPEPGSTADDANADPRYPTRASTSSSGAHSDGTERPVSFSRPRPPSTLYHGPNTLSTSSSLDPHRTYSIASSDRTTHTYSVASTTAFAPSLASHPASIFSTTNAAPAIDPAADPAGRAAQHQIMNLLLAHPLHASERVTIAEADEKLVRAVLGGLQRACGALVWAGAVPESRVGMDEVRRRLEGARGAMEGTEVDDGDDDDGEEGDGDSVDGDRFVAL